MKKSPLLIIFLTVFIDLIGFGIVLPLLPIYSDTFGASGLIIGLIMASFSAMQFLFAPAWGRLSDRIGRRPVLLISTAGAAGSYALFGIGSGMTSASAALTVILLSRVVAGICGANITVAQACIADVTPVDQRSKRMGLIGMAFGLGFIFGPALGGISIQLFGTSGPGWVAAALCAANLLLAFWVLPETRQPSTAPTALRPHLAEWTETLRRPGIGLLIVVFFLATFCFTCFETTLSLLVAHNFKLIEPGTHISTIDLLNREKFAAAAATGSYLFVWCGLIGAFVQGGPLGRLVRRFGEVNLIAWSLVLVGISLAPLPFIRGEGRLSWAALASSAGGPWWLMLAVLAVLSVGSSLTRPPLFGLISILTPADRQGATLGVAQSVGSLARILGPIFAAGLYDLLLPLPYLVCAAIALVTGLVAWRQLRTFSRDSQPDATGATATPS